MASHEMRLSMYLYSVQEGSRLSFDFFVFDRREETEVAGGVLFGRSEAAEMKRGSTSAPTVSFDMRR